MCAKKYPRFIYHDDSICIFEKYYLYEFRKLGENYGYNENY
jgi:hypothetical protein